MNEKMYRCPKVAALPPERVLTYCLPSTEREYVGSTDACHCGAGRTASPELRSQRQPPNSSSKYSVRAVHVVGTFGRLFSCAVSVYAFGVAMSGPPRVRSSLSEPRWSVPRSVARRKLWKVTWPF